MPKPPRLAAAEAEAMLLKWEARIRQLSPMLD